MKINSRSSNLLLLLAFFAIFAGAAYGLTLAWAKKNDVVQKISNLNNKKYSLEEAAKGLRVTVKNAEDTYKDAQVFMTRVQLYQNVTEKMSQGGTRTRQQIETLAQSNRVTSRDWSALSDTTRTVDNVIYIGRSYKLVVLGEFRNIGKLIADMENTVPLLRMTSVQLFKDADSNTQSTSISGNLTFMIISNIAEAGPNTSEVTALDLHSTTPRTRTQ